MCFDKKHPSFQSIVSLALRCESIHLSDTNDLVRFEISDLWGKTVSQKDAVADEELTMHHKYKVNYYLQRYLAGQNQVNNFQKLNKKSLAKTLEVPRSSGEFC